MKPKLILGLALVLSTMMFGCSAFDNRSANSKPSTPDLYLHLFASFVYPEQPRLIVSAPIPRSGDFDIPMATANILKDVLSIGTENFSSIFNVACVTEQMSSTKKLNLRNDMNLGRSHTMKKHRSSASRTLFFRQIPVLNLLETASRRRKETLGA